MIHCFFPEIQTLEQEQDAELKSRNVALFNEEVALLYLTKLDAVIGTNRGHLVLSKVCLFIFLTDKDPSQKSSKGDYYSEDEHHEPDDLLDGLTMLQVACSSYISQGLLSDDDGKLMKTA